MRTDAEVDLSAGLGWVEEVFGEPVVEAQRLSGGWTSTLLQVAMRDHEPVVLRLMTNEPWRTHGEALTTRESEIQRMLETTEVPAPRSLALDAMGDRCGHPAHLMSLLPGVIEPQRYDDSSLVRLAGLVASIHEIAPTIDVRSYQSWAWEAKFVVPEWGTDPGLWEDAFALLRGEVPAYDPCFIHRDFHPRNVLWDRDEITGIVDWVETSIGPAWLDVAHCATNLAIAHGTEVADRFADAYVTRTGRVRQSYFDVMDVVGFLPPPGKTTFITDPAELTRLENRLATVLARCG
ncbi:Phosphotransferase enzyme family protein [Nocardioides sp. YR527]|uniref:phosphotransferase family protein n=1 Tax=Nocardioides sp. YR527 TaxID=1881028 RepID=UPI00088EF05E|nr:aminoglycoside phosphotransferase family protein [Nocardioides sp. YR527]SDJ98020.1 Phosphotransferase enzyme family protein [Nocardioides sp. YR527]